MPVESAHRYVLSSARVLGRLQGLDGVDVQQRTEHEPVVLRIVNDSPVGSHDKALRMPPPMGLAVCHPDHERLERFAMKNPRIASAFIAGLP